MRENFLKGITLFERGLQSNDIELQTTAAIHLIRAYNDAPAPDLFPLLIELLLPAAEKQRQKTRYETARAVLAPSGTCLPNYEELPVLCIPLFNGEANILFDKENDCFLLGKGTIRRYELYRKMMTQGDIAPLLHEWKSILQEEQITDCIMRLWNLTRKECYSEEYQALLQQLKELDTANKVPFYYFSGMYALNSKDYPAALKWGKKAYSLRKVNADIWALLTLAYEGVGEIASAHLYKGLQEKHAVKFIGAPLALNSPENHNAYLRGKLQPEWAPFYFCPEKKTPDFRLKSAHGEFLINQPQGDNLRYYCGVYNDGDYFLNVRSRLLSYYEQQKTDSIYDYCNFTFDIIKACPTQKAELQPQELDGAEHCLLPLMATKENQNILIHDEEQNEPDKCIMGKEETRFFRMRANAYATSDTPFMAGAPIPLIHNPKRKRLVLNLLLDGLSWHEMKRTHFQYVPNLIRFFSKGIIFQSAYSESEYTFPSLASIETGLHTHRHQVFHTKVFSEINSEQQTISEHAKQLGYYCVNPIGDARGIYSGATRGFDRLLVSPYLNAPAHEAVKRTIDYLDAFAECDSYVFVHIGDPHPYPETVPPRLSTQTQFQHGNCASENGIPSVRLKGTDTLRKSNRYVISRMDAALGLLFDYLEHHYTENELLVHAYSDHGASIYNPNRDPWFFTDEQCCTAMLARGESVPSLGFVDELVSTLDLYAIQSKTIGFSADLSQLDTNLPAAFGGKEREYVISNSIFPGQTYKLGIRTKSHEFRLETRKPTRMDGTVDMSQFSWKILTRNATPSVLLDDCLKDYFLQLAERHTASFRHSYL